jgi:hypothetical protein
MRRAANVSDIDTRLGKKHEENSGSVRPFSLR